MTDEIRACLARIETLTDWCRKNVEPPPSTLLYQAASAVDLLRAALDRELLTSNPPGDTP